MATTVPEVPVVPVVPTTPTTPSDFVAANSGSAGQVYSANNIAQTTTAPVAAPNLSDPFGLYNYYMNTPDITAAKESAKTAQAQLLERTKAARDQQQQLGQNLQSTNRIRGNQQNAQQLATNDIQALNEAYTLAASNVDALTSTAKEKMAIAEQSRNEIKQMISATGGKAGISYADTYETAVAKQKKYEDKIAKEAKKDAEKEVLKGMYTQLTGKQAKSMSLGALRKKVSDLGGNAKAAADAAKLKTSGSQKENVYSKIDAAFTKSGGDWEKTAKELSKTMDVSTGSVADNELRRRFGLPAIDKSVTATDLNSEINRQISQIEDWDTASDDEKRMFIRSKGGDPSKFGL